MATFARTLCASPAPIAACPTHSSPGPDSTSDLRSKYPLPSWMEQGWDTEIKSEANSSPLSSNATLVEDGSPGPKQTAWVDGMLQEEAYWHDYPADTLLPSTFDLAFYGSFRKGLDVPVDKSTTDVADDKLNFEHDGPFGAEKKVSVLVTRLLSAAKIADLASYEIQYAVVQNHNHMHRRLGVDEQYWREVEMLAAAIERMKRAVRECRIICKTLATLVIATDAPQPQDLARWARIGGDKLHIAKISETGPRDWPVSYPAGFEPVTNTLISPSSDSIDVISSAVIWGRQAVNTPECGQRAQEDVLYPKTTPCSVPSLGPSLPAEDEMRRLISLQVGHLYDLAATLLRSALSRALSLHPDWFLYAVPPTHRQNLMRVLERSNIPNRPPVRLLLKAPRLCGTVMKLDHWFKPKIGVEGIREEVRWWEGHAEMMRELLGSLGPDSEGQGEWDKVSMRHLIQGKRKAMSRWAREARGEWASTRY